MSDEIKVDKIFIYISYANFSYTCGWKNEIILEIWVLQG